MMKEPIQNLDGANVLCWLQVDENITFSGKIIMFHDGVLIDNPAAFAICRNDEDLEDLLVFYCDSNWVVLAAAGYDSIEKAKDSMEVAYTGTLNRWEWHSTYPEWSS